MISGLVTKQWSDVPRKTHKGETLAYGLLFRGRVETECQTGAYAILPVETMLRCIPKNQPTLIRGSCSDSMTWETLACSQDTDIEQVQYADDKEQPNRGPE